MSDSALCVAFSQLFSDMSRAVSSAYENNLSCSSSFPNANTYMIYKIGDSTVSCRTPFLIFNSLLKVFDILTTCFLSCRYYVSRLNDL